LWHGGSFCKKAGKNLEKKFFKIKIIKKKEKPREGQKYNNLNKSFKSIEMNNQIEAAVLYNRGSI